MLLMWFSAEHFSRKFTHILDDVRCPRRISAVWVRAKRKFTLWFTLWFCGIVPENFRIEQRCDMFMRVSIPKMARNLGQILEAAACINSWVQKKWWCVHVWKPQCFLLVPNHGIRATPSWWLKKKVVWNLYVASRGTTSSFRIYCIKGGIIRTKPIHQSIQKWFGNCYLHAGVKNAIHRISKFHKDISNPARDGGDLFWTITLRARRMWQKKLPTEFARFPSDIFHCGNEVPEVRRVPRSHSMMQLFTVEKLQLWFAKMRTNKCADVHGFDYCNLEMFKEGNPVSWQTLIHLYNHMSVTGQFWNYLAEEGEKEREREREREREKKKNVFIYTYFFHDPLQKGLVTS